MREKPRNSQQRALWAAQERSRRRLVAPRNYAQTADRTRRGHQSQSTVLPKRSRKRSWFLRSVLLVTLLVVISGGIFGYKIIAASDNITDTERSILGQLKDLLFQSGNALAGETDDRVNVLLIAVGGSGHKGENLADTIMVASIKPSSNAAALVSIPRDLYVQVPEQEYYSKINAVHAYGESQREGEGPQLLKQITEEITGVPIHYYVRVDFTAFKGIVDAVGGINVGVENSFYDYWHKISFPAGTEKMNGERSLAYVRARYIEGPEGGDFRRAARQQQVLLALREKVFSVQTALDFTRANAILNSLSENIRTDMQLWEMRRFYELARLIEPQQVQSAVLTTGPKGVLAGGTEILGGVPASVLRPRTGDYSEIQKITRDIFTTTQDQSLTAAQQAPPPEAEAIEQPPQEEASPAPEPTKPTIEIRNGTTIAGLAKRTSDKLTQQDYDVTTIGNATARDTTETTVYAISENHAVGAQTLAEFLSAIAENGLPEGEATTTAEVLIVLGSDANNSEQ